MSFFAMSAIDSDSDLFSLVNAQEEQQQYNYYDLSVPRHMITIAMTFIMELLSSKS
jgi:hypothetical protein